MRNKEKKCKRYNCLVTGTKHLLNNNEKENNNEKQNGDKKTEFLNYDLFFHIFKMIKSNLFSDPLDQTFYNKFLIKYHDMGKYENNIFNIKIYSKDSATETDKGLHLFSPSVIKSRLENFLKFVLKQTDKNKLKTSVSVLNILDHENLRIILNESQDPVIKGDTIYKEIRNLFITFLNHSGNIFTIKPLTENTKTNQEVLRPNIEIPDFRFDLSKIQNRLDYSNRFIFYGQIILEFLENQNKENIIVTLINCPIHKYINNNNIAIKIINELIKPLFYEFGHSGCNCSYEILNPSFSYVSHKNDELINEKKNIRNSPSQFIIDNTNKLIQQACYLLNIYFYSNNNCIVLGETRNSLNGAYYYTYLYNNKIWEVENSKSVNLWVKGVIPENYTNIFYHPTVTDSQTSNNINKDLNDSEYKRTRGRPKKDHLKPTQHTINNDVEMSSLISQSETPKDPNLIKKYIKKADHIECMNCGTNSTSLWRKHENKTICNSCGLYFRLHGKHRSPKKKDIVRRRRRINGILQPSKASKEDIEKNKINNKNIFVGENNNKRGQTSDK